MSKLDMSSLTEFDYIFEKLKSQYGWSLNKRQLCEVLKCGTSTLDTMIKKGHVPKSLKFGTSKQSAIVFSIYHVAKFIIEEAGE